MLNRIYYAPGDWLVRHTSARGRRAFGAWLLIFWLGPGFVLWLLFLRDLWFVGFMSIVALWWTGLSTVGTETPVEAEDTEVTE